MCNQVELTLFIRSCRTEFDLFWGQSEKDKCKFKIFPSLHYIKKNKLIVLNDELLLCNKNVWFGQVMYKTEGLTTAVKGEWGVGAYGLKVAAFFIWANQEPGRPTTDAFTYHR